MRLVRVLLSSLLVTTLALPLAQTSASAKPKKAAKSSKTRNPAAAPAAEQVQLDEDADATPATKPATEKSSETSDSVPDASGIKPAESKAHAEESSPPATSDSTPRPSPFDLEAGLRAVNRNFDYKDAAADLFPNRGYVVLAPFHLALGPALFFDGTFYPGALATSGVAAHLGLAFGYELNFATKAVFAQGLPIERTLHTQASQFYVGARARIPLGPHELGLLAAYGEQKFQLTGDEGAPVAPDVHYKFVRLAADAKFAFGEVSLGGHLGTRLVSSTGGLQSEWFANTKTKSLEAGIFLGYRLSRALDLIAAGDLVRYAFDFNPNPVPAPTDTPKPIAGGATDQYLTGSLALRFHVPSASADN